MWSAFWAALYNSYAGGACEKWETFFHVPDLLTNKRLRPDKARAASYKRPPCLLSIHILSVERHSRRRIVCEMGKLLNPNIIRTMIHTDASRTAYTIRGRPLGEIEKGFHVHNFLPNNRPKPKAFRTTPNHTRGRVAGEMGKINSDYHPNTGGP